MSDIEMHYRFERYWEENASKDTWANKSVAFNVWQSRQAEIDGLTIKLNGANERAMSLLNHKNRMVDKMQAEIDSLNKNIEALHVEIERIQKEYQGMFEGVQGRQKTIDELQVQIDGAMKYVSESPLKDVSRRAMINFMDILKGNKDD